MIEPQNIDNEESLKEEAKSLVERACIIPVEFFSDPHHDPPIAKTPLDLVEIFDDKKKNMADYFYGQITEIAYHLAMYSSFNGKTIDLRNMTEQDKINYRYAINYWKEYLYEFKLEEIPGMFEKAILAKLEDKSTEAHQACIDLVCKFCGVEEYVARAMIPE